MAEDPAADASVADNHRPEPSTAELWDEAGDQSDAPSAGDDSELDLDEIGRPRVPGWVAEAEPEDLALAVEAVSRPRCWPASFGAEGSCSSVISTRCSWSPAR